MKPTWIKEPFDGGSGIPPGGWIIRGMPVGNPVCALDVVWSETTVLLTVPLGGRVLVVGAKVRPVGTVKLVAESVPVGIIETGAVEVGVVAVVLGAMVLGAVVLGAVVSTTVGGVETGVVVVPTELGAVVASDDVGTKLMVTELVPRGTTVVDTDRDAVSLLVVEERL